MPRENARKAALPKAGVSPSRGRSSPAREAVLEAAVRLFCRDGISATGIEAILAESGVARMTVYNQFGSKEGLVAAALEHEGAAWRAWFFARLAEIPGGPRERLIGIFDLLAEWFVRDDYYGCAFMNAVAEHRNRDKALLQATLSHKSHIIEQIRALAAAAGMGNPDRVAGQIDLLMDGAIIKSMIKKSPEPAREAKEMAVILLGG